MAKYAENTSVPVDRSKAEIERTLDRYGAQAFMYGRDQERAMVGFMAHGRQIRFYLPLPTESDVAITAAGRKRASGAIATAMEQEERRRWRALALAIKAKLEVVESGISTFEQEFLANIVMPDGSLFADGAVKAIATTYETGSMPRLLPAAGGA